jgi:hypothetical protein
VAEVRLPLPKKTPNLAIKIALRSDREQAGVREVIAGSLMTRAMPAMEFLKLSDLDMDRSERPPNLWGASRGEPEDLDVDAG